MIDIGTEPFQDASSFQVVWLLNGFVEIIWICFSRVPSFLEALKIQLLYAVVVSFLFGVSMVIICKDRCH